MIEVAHLYKSYKSHIVLRDINLSMRKGQCVALIGPNGSGKTTLIKCILGIARQDRGQILFNGQPVETRDDLKGRIGYIPQLSRFPSHMRTGELFTLLRRLRKDYTTYDTDMYDNLGVDEFSNRSLGILSEGMKQKVSAALAFYFNPDVLILDEPTAGLDPVANEILKTKILKSLEESKLVLISSHILSDLDEITTHVAYLLEGQLQVSEDLESLRNQSGEHSLKRIIAGIMEQNKTQWVK